MSFYQELPYPVYVSTGGVQTSGGTELLKPGMIGLFNAATYTALDAGANPVANPEVIIAGGSWHSKDSLTQFIGGLSQSVKSQEFLGKDVLEFHRSLPNDLSQDIIQIGWDGVNACDGLVFECGKTYYFKINVQGEDVYRTFNRPLYRIIALQTECCPDSDCTDGCSNLVDPVAYAKKLAALINDDPELKYFVKAEAVIEGYVSPGATHTQYTLTFCDNGDISALSAVQQAYPTERVTRLSRSGSNSTYQLVKLTGLPAAFTPTQPVSMAVCGSCPAGWTTQAARSYWIVKRPLAGTESLIDNTAKQTYANTVTTAYSGSGGKFLATDGATATIQFYGAQGATVNALLADSVTFSHNEPVKCVPPASGAVAWVAGETRYRPTRTQCLTLNKTCGGANRLAEIVAYYAAIPNSGLNTPTVSAAGTCADTYVVTQSSDEALKDGCLSPASATFSPIPSFDGFAWEDCPCPADIPVTDTLTGVRITGAYVDTRFGNCSFDVTDYYSQAPIRVGASQINEDGSPCAEVAKVTVLQRGQRATQSGEWLIRQYLKASSLEAYNIWANDSRLRDVFDQHALSFIDRNKRYKVYYIVYKQNRDGANWDSQHTQDKFETIVAFEEGVDSTNFENVFGGYFANFGVVLKDRGTTTGGY